jgi:polyhydroxyalkanoate synthase
VLIVAAPIKRPYIWDLAPSVSAIRRCLREGLHVYLVEWLPASRDDGDVGLDDSLVAIADCVSRIGGADGAGRPVVIGHSLGGTLAAIYAASAPDTVGTLVLLGAPLCFAPQTSEFRDALVSLVPPLLSETEPFPGSLLSHMSALASPNAFVWERLMDAALNFADGHAMEIHARIERWALDEVALPGKLVRQILEDLYRDNRLFRGDLAVRGTLVGPASLTVPTLAVVNMSDDVAPLAATEPFISAMPFGGGRIISYPGEAGVGLQHLGILVGRKAQAEIWPQIVAWMRAPG